MSERKPIDAALRRFLDELPSPPANLADAERVAFLRAAMLRARDARGSIPGLPNDVATEDLEIAQGLRARVYRPARKSSDAVLVYFHGGGWVTGSIETHDPFCRLLTKAAGVAILSVDYRLAPEHRYPAAAEDALAAVQWALSDSEFRDVAVGGDSAGANLAAVVANQLGPQLRAQLLLFPVADHHTANRASWTENATGFGLEASPMRWFWEQYAPGISADDARASPLRARDLPKLAPAFVATSEYDVLRDEGLAYAEMLEKAGAQVTRLHAHDMHHNFAVNPWTVMRFPQSESALQEIASWLRKTLT